MNLLLLLSALLSALTGATAGSRAAPATAVAERVVTRAVVGRVAQAPQRPRQDAPSRATPERARVTLVATPLASVPLYLLRRRE